MDIILLISLILMALSGLFALVKQLQMLQQSSYFPSRYFGWVKNDYLIHMTLELFVSAFMIRAVRAESGLITSALAISVLAVRAVSAAVTQKKSIKKLVFTGRIKRFYGAATILFAALIILYTVFRKEFAGEAVAVITIAFSLISPLLAFFCRFITAPVDKAISNWYINDAKHILREHKDLLVIGVTGSYGKTTTKFILERILSEKYNVVATPQSFNTPMGVVRTVREKLKPQTQIFICEMGAKNVGDIKEICDIAHPKYGIITSVGAQHLETFKSVDNVFKTKLELADEVLKNGGEVFVNGDSAELISRIDSSLYNIYGTGNFNASAQNISYGKGGSEFTFKSGDNEIPLSTKLLGMHSIINITGAVALALKLGIAPEYIRYAVASLKPTEHRLELKPYINGSIMIDDAYNSNPEGCIEAVNVLASFEGMQKVIITPGLVELGSKEYDCNFALGLEAAKKCDIIILVGLTRSRPLREGAESVGFDTEKLFTVSSFKEAQTVYSKYADKNTVVLIENDLPDNYLK